MQRNVVGVHLFPGNILFRKKKLILLLWLVTNVLSILEKEYWLWGKDEVASVSPLGYSASILLSKCGWIAYYEWLRISRYSLDIEVDVFVIMPNHIHGIIFLRENKDKSYPEEKVRLGGIIGRYKSEVFNKCVKDGLWKQSTPGHLWRPHFKYYRIHNVEDYRSLKYYISRDSERWCKNQHPECGSGELE